MLQVLIYQALGFQEPAFGHVSLILAPDKSKLSKRHGATSVGEFRAQGYLPKAMINYLSLLGWNDGTEQVSTKLLKVVARKEHSRLPTMQALLRYFAQFSSHPCLHIASLLRWILSCPTSLPVSIVSGIPQRAAQLWRT